MNKTVSQATGAGKGRVRNRILSITRNIIPYVKELRRLPSVKSISACVLLQQLDYWFERYPDGFWKFLAPCEDHSAYTKGNSWTEELGMSGDEFRTAFDQIGVRYKSKKEHDAAVDKFAGKYYCSYTDKVARMTYYYRNHAAVDAALNTLQSPEMASASSYEEAIPAPREWEGQSPELDNAKPHYKETTKEITKDSRESESVAHATLHSQSTQVGILGFLTAKEEDLDVIDAEPVFDLEAIAAQTPGRACPLPDNFHITEEMLTWAEANVAEAIDLGRATEKFKAYHRGRANKDWLGAWRLWMMRERPEASLNGGPAHKGSRGYSRASIARAKELHELGVKFHKDENGKPRFYIR